MWIYIEYWLREVTKKVFGHEDNRTFLNLEKKKIPQLNMATKLEGGGGKALEAGALKLPLA